MKKSHIKQFLKNLFNYQCLSQMGYCPENNAIVECLDTYAHLKLFARLRGLPESMVNIEVEKWIGILSEKVL